MKITLLTLGIIASFGCLAQKGSSTIECLGDDVLYRGYLNKVTLNIDRNEDRHVELHGTDVSIAGHQEDNTFVVKPVGSAKIATLHILAVEGDKMDTLTTVNYRVMNLPVPDVYWGGVKSGGIADRENTQLFVRYPDGIELPNDFRIVGWEIYLSEENILQGNGNDFSEVKEQLDQLETGTVLIFTVKVLSPDGITRLTKAQWGV